MKTRTASMYCFFLASALCLGAAIQADQSKTNGKKVWTPKDAVAAFNTVLTRAGYDRSFRDTLKTSPASASETVRQAVSEVGQIEIPQDVLIIFHEPETCSDIYPFYLPKPTELLQPYWRYFQGCMSKFPLSEPSRTGVPKSKRQAGEQEEPKKTWTSVNIAAAFTAVLRRSQIDADFRKDLTKSMSSAKYAVAKEGGIEIPPEVVILFHDDESNEKFHMFRLPPFDPNARTNYEYRTQFEGFYFVW